jgi:peptidoglycan/LPS O-acetylase OafA/YrhL
VDVREAVFVFAFFGVFFAVSHGKTRIFEWGPLVFLGSISYTLYLLHQNLGFVALDALRGAGISADIAVPLVIMAVLALATLVSLTIERPAMAAIRGWYKRRVSAASPCTPSPR